MVKDSEAQIEKSEQFEGFEANPYPDPCTGGEPWAFGFGSTRDAEEMPVTPRTAPITYNEACDLAMRDMYRAFHAIASDITMPLTGHEIAAVMDFIYNVGAGNFKSSSVFRMINERQFDLAAKEFARWDEAGGKVMAGLLRRRSAAERIFNTEDS